MFRFPWPVTRVIQALRARSPQKIAQMVPGSTKVETSRKKVPKVEKKFRLLVVTLFYFSTFPTGPRVAIDPDPHKVYSFETLGRTLSGLLGSWPGILFPVWGTGSIASQEVLGTSLVFFGIPGLKCPNDSCEGPRRWQASTEFLLLILTWWTLGYLDFLLWGLFRSPQPYNLSEKYWRYTSNLYSSTPPICSAVPCWLLSFGERETPQYTSNLYCNTPPICTAVRLLFVPAIFLGKYQRLGVPESS